MYGDGSFRPDALLLNRSGLLDQLGVDGRRLHRPMCGLFQNIGEPP
jgi:hypothetical protein